MENSRWSRFVPKFGERVGSIYLYPQDVLAIKNGLNGMGPAYAPLARMEDGSYCALVCSHGNPSGLVKGFDGNYHKASEVVESVLRRSPDGPRAEKGGLSKRLCLLCCYNGTVPNQTAFGRIRIDRAFDYKGVMYLSELDEFGDRDGGYGMQRVFVYTQAIPPNLRALIKDIESELIDSEAAYVYCKNKNYMLWKDAKDLRDKCVSSGMYGFRCGFRKEESLDTCDTFVVIVPCKKKGVVYTIELKYDQGNYRISVWNENEGDIVAPYFDYELMSPEFQIPRIAELAKILWDGEDPFLLV